MKANTLSVLSCHQARDFWISWKGGLIEVGTGKEVGHSPIITWDDPEFEPIMFATLSTGLRTKGQWWIDQEQGEAHFL